MPEDQAPSFDGPTLDDRMEDWLRACGDVIDGYGHMTDFSRENMIRYGRFVILLEEKEVPSPYPGFPPDHVWVGVLPVPDTGTFHALVRCAAETTEVSDREEEEPRTGGWCRLFAAESWEHLDEMLEGKYAALIRRAREIEGPEASGVG
jgi:hypothetical protein